MKTIFLNETLAIKKNGWMQMKQNFMHPKKLIRYVGLLLIMIIAGNLLYAQKDEKFKLDEIKQQCASLPLDKRARVSVTSFKVTTATSTQDDAKKSQQSGIETLRSIFGNKNGGDGSKTDKPQPTLGDNLASMLTTALQNVNCYRVLESLDNNGDLTKEIDASKYSGKNNTPKSGKQLGAQIVVTGEITEYSTSEKGVSVMGVGSKNKIIKLGFTLNMINPETRDVVFSRPFRVQSKTGKTVNVLFVSSNNSDPAVAAVMQDGVIQAVQYMAHLRDSLNITSDGNFAGNANENGEKQTEITLNNANFTSFNNLAGIISGLSVYKSMDKSLSSGVGSYTVTHSGSTDALVNLLNKKIGSAYEITGAEAGKIDLKVK